MLSLPEDSEGMVRSSSQAATCPLVYYTRRRLQTVPLIIAERHAGKLWIPIFVVFGLTRPEIAPKSTASAAEALSTQPLICINWSECVDIKNKLSLTQPGCFTMGVSSQTDLPKYKLFNL